jgi:hypothetical protein
MLHACVYEMSADGKQGVQMVCILRANEPSPVPKIEIKDGEIFCKAGFLNGP